MDFPTFHKKMLEFFVSSPTYVSSLEWLFRNAKAAVKEFPAHALLDLGTDAGMTAYVMAEAVLSTRSSSDVKAHVYSIDKYIPPHHPEAVFYKNMQKMERMGYDSVLTLINSDDIEYLEQVEDNSVAMIWIDSNHTYEHVKRLLDIVLPKVVSGGHICGHDYSFVQSGVVYAVEEWREENSDALIGFGVYDTCWWTIMKGDK